MRLQVPLSSSVWLNLAVAVAFTALMLGQMSLFYYSFGKPILPTLPVIIIWSLFGIYLFAYRQFYQSKNA
jgi:hypothetical protein